MVEVGSIVKVAGIDWIVLDKKRDAVLCLTKKFVYDRQKFDNNTNNYAKSEIRKKLNTEFLDQIINAIGEYNLLETDIDLTSDDGLDDYGMVFDKVGLLTCDMYRRYNRIIEKYPVDYWWWLATAWSTPHRGYNSNVRCVNDFGALYDYDCYVRRGVRPFVSLNLQSFNL